MPTGRESIKDQIVSDALRSLIDTSMPGKTLWTTRGLSTLQNLSKYFLLRLEQKISALRRAVITQIGEAKLLALCEESLPSSGLPSLSLDMFKSSGYRTGFYPKQNTYRVRKPLKPVRICHGTFGSLPRSPSLQGKGKQVFFN